MLKLSKNKNKYLIDRIYLSVFQLFRLIFIHIIIFNIWACYPEKNSSNRKILKYNQADNISSLDPAFAKSQNNIWAVNQIYDGLVYQDKIQGIQGRIAKSWTFNAERTEISFIIDTTYEFHENECFDTISSRSVNAHDVVYSFERILSNEVNSPGSWIFTDIVSEKEPFVALNDTIFVLSLKKPFNPVLGILTTQYCSIVPKEAVSYYGLNFRKNPVGTGPFQFKRWKENHALYLIRNDKYPDIKHNLDGIKVSFIPDEKIAFFEFLNGNLDFISGVESSYSSEILNPDGSLRSDKVAEIKMIHNPYLNLEYIGINIEKASESLLASPEFRKALNLSINRSEMLSVFKNNIGKPANQGVIPRGLPSFRSSFSGFSYNPDEAIRLLDSLEYNPQKFQLNISTNPEYLDIITYAAKSFENIGIKTNIELLESAVLRQQMRNGTLDCFRASWIADYPDGESFLCLFYGANPAPPNYTRFKSEAFDQMYSKAVIEVDQNIRLGMYDQLNKMIIDQAPLIPLYYDETAIFVNRSIISGMDPNAMNLLDTRQIIKINNTLDE